MNKIRMTCVAAGVATSFSAFAAATVDNVTMAQAADTHEVTVTYTLTEPAIVTFAVETNELAQGAGAWIRLSGDCTTHVRGDVNRIVADATGTKTIVWLPHKSWPGHYVDEGRVRAVVTAYALDNPPDYFVMDLGNGSDVSFYADKESIPDGVTNRKYKTEYLVMRKIPAANIHWRMGSPTTESGRNKNFEVPHTITLTSDFYLGVYEVTQYQWWRVMGTNPSTFTGADYPDWQIMPVETIDPNRIGVTGDAIALPSYRFPSNADLSKTTFPGQLSASCPYTDNFRIPTEAQWEFACRAGTGSAYNYGGDATGDELKAVACFATNHTQAVGLLKPNAWGLYDMHGNVGEWIADYWRDNTTDTEHLEDPTGPESMTSSMRAFRGGSFSSSAADVRSAAYGSQKWWSSPYLSTLGFRVSCPAAFILPNAN